MSTSSFGKRTGLEDYKKAAVVGGKKLLRKDYGSLFTLS